MTGSIEKTSKIGCGVVRKGVSRREWPKLPRSEERHEQRISFGVGNMEAALAA